MSERASESLSTWTDSRNQPETHPAPQAPTRGEAPARGKWGRDSPMLGGVILPGENTVRPRMRTPSASEAAV